MTQLAPVITIDGPTASGKGTVAHRVASALGFSVLDSGALYRLTALSILNQQIDPDDANAVAGAAQAESSVTLYGIMDAGVRYDSDSAKLANGDPTSQTQMVYGVIAPSRFGIKGTEDLNG